MLVGDHLGQSSDDGQQYDGTSRPAQSAPLLSDTERTPIKSRIGAFGWRPVAPA
jgi:hypothetical protein